MITRGILWNCFYMWQDLPSLWCNIAINCDQFLFARTKESKTVCKIMRASNPLIFSKNIAICLFKGCAYCPCPREECCLVRSSPMAKKPDLSHCHHLATMGIRHHPVQLIDLDGPWNYCWTKFREFLRIDRESYLTRYKIRKQMWWSQECIFKGGRVATCLKAKSIMEQLVWKRGAGFIADTDRLFCGKHNPTLSQNWSRYSHSVSFTRLNELINVKTRKDKVHLELLLKFKEWMQHYLNCRAIGWLLPH